MPNPTDGLHTPITNLSLSEAANATTLISDGSPADVGELPLMDETDEESLPREIRESTFESTPAFTAPEDKNLLDIGVASFGQSDILEVVLGTDERYQIQETEKFPWSAMASLLITAADDSQWIGTGWFISDRTLATAGHCVYIKDSGTPGRDGWVKKIQVMPGRNGKKLPYGSMTSNEFWTVKGWGDEGLENYDYAAIILPSAFPKKIGSFSYGVYTDKELLTFKANVAGYPGDKPAGTLWYDNRKVANVNQDKVYYKADTVGGQSGCPVYAIRNKKRIGIAVHAYGGKTSNSGTRISTPVFHNLESWKKK